MFFKISVWSFATPLTLWLKWMSMFAMCTLPSLSMIWTNGSSYFAAIILSSFSMTGTSWGTAFSRKLLGQVSRASARIVWFV